MGTPNILIFMTDHQRADTVLPEHGCITPNLDRFAAEGVTFTKTFCPTPHCCPARAAFFSGLYSSRNGIWNNVLNEQSLNTSLKPGVRLWSEDLADAGYRMHFCGKWHVSAEEWPRDRGWEELMVTAGPRDHHGNKWDRFRELAAQPEPTERGEGQILRPGYGTYTAYGSRQNEPHDTVRVETAIEALPDIASGEGPWCLYVGAIGPHDPYVVPRKYLDMYDVEDVPLPSSYADEMRDKPFVYQRMRDSVFGQLTEREVREGIRHFWAYCTYLDDVFGRLLEALDATGQADNTLVMYCSDHGDYCGEHGLFAKGIPSFLGAYNVPMVVRWPDGIADPGRRVDELVSLTDVAPTMLELAGLPIDRDFSGASLAPFLRGEKPGDWRDALYFQCDGVELYFTQRQVLTADYKYVFNGFDRDELYDMRKDPDEMVNVADDPAYADVKRAMCGRMWRFAEREQDGVMSTAYITVGFAPYGPAEAFRTD
jgi:arylsulfatase A-like enzyme